MALHDAVEQSRGRNAERSRELDDCAEARFARGSLEAGDLGRVEIAGVTEGFLGQAGAVAFSADVATEGLLRRLHAADPLSRKPKALEPKPQVLGSLPRFRQCSQKVERCGCMRSTWMVAVGAALVLVSAQPAVASLNAGPSRAIEVSAGVPFAGSWPGTPEAHTGCCDYWHWYRPNFALRTGDVLQLAIDNRLGPDLSLCFTSPTDEFGAAEALRRECGSIVYDPDDVPTGQMRRERIVYQRTQPNGFLLLGSYTPDDVTQTGSYTITIERVLTRINIGILPPARVKRSFSLSAALRYGDNTPAVDGSTATLQYRRGRGSSGPRRFSTIASGASTAGTVAFETRLPRHVGPAVQLRACADQPGATKPRCTRAYRAVLS